MLQKKNQNKNAYYKVGEAISYRTLENKFKVTSEILDLEDGVILIKDDEVKVEEITHLYLDEKTKWWLRYKVQQLSLILGGGYLLLNLINKGELDSDVLIVSGSLIATGLLAKLIIGNKIHIKGRTKLRTIIL